VEPDGGGAEVSESSKKVVFATPTLTRPLMQYVDALEASVPAIEAAGWQHEAVFEVGCPYISAARATMTRKALDAGADVICYLDHDLSWGPEDIKTLLETEGDVVAGLYRFKRDDEETYMGTVLTDANDRPIVRADGCIKGDKVPAGFLKITKEAIRRFMKAYPDLLYGEPDRYSVDLFNHGAIDGVWFGEDYAFSKRWQALGGDIWIVPDLDITHWASVSRRVSSNLRYHSEKAFPGNFHRLLLAQPGGSEAPAL
jgi:glycosyltransferase involved in cell wall biosynthesis